MTSAQPLPCRTISISPIALQVSGPVIGTTGERVSAVFPHLGEVSGVVGQTGRTGFELRIDAARTDQARLAATINWLKRRHMRTAANKRASRRIRLGNTKALFVHEGTRVACTLIDMSETGAAVAAASMPPLGDTVTIGEVAGVVQRRLEGGFAVRFVAAEPIETLLARLSHGPADGEHGDTSPSAEAGLDGTED
jgi:hypothetical protein